MTRIENLSGKTALVTGGSRSIGAAIICSYIFSLATLQPKAANASCSIPATTQAPRPGSAP